METNMAAKKKLSFEEKLERLEEINSEISAGEIPLEESVHMFEEGMKIARELEKQLAVIERKIEILVNKPLESGEPPEMELFDSLE